MTDETQAVLDRVRAHLDFYAAALRGEYDASRVIDHGKVTADLRTLLATVDALREDARRMDTLQNLLRGADFSYGENADEMVVLLTLPAGVRVGADIRAFADAARVGGQP